MRLRLLLLVSLIYSVSFSQELYSDLLANKLLHSNSNDFVRVRFEFKDNVDCYYMNQSMKDNQTNVVDRPKLVITALQNQANSSQETLLEYLKSNPNVKDIQSFWIVNLVVCKIKKSELENFPVFDDVAFVDLEENKFIPTPKFTIENNANPKSLNGTEPGLVAINAPAMWALGYTGRGTMVYDYDTGVWPDHPAFSDRFLANRFPLDQCWYGYFSDVPNGLVNNHGTHTLGTMAGLDENTNDTIGVAYKAYWIANDFVTPTVEGLPPITDMIGAFQWALNPDGDISTSDDVPDVINNSWRWYDGNDTLHCGGYIVDLMNAIEAAGIANIFSGGNSGPDNTTVNSPQRINTTEVNTFSVGAVNGNLDFPHPITDFSTRGPKQCPGTGSLLIHPEVVAPGFSVRSAWGHNEYNSISGTSMSAPHVSGAVLLLKEAFPYLTGEDLLWALYLTAIDLGDAGEDNVYGNGLIDVYAAYQYLAATNTPVSPSADYDLSIDLNSPSRDGFICGDQLQIDIDISNLGSNLINAISFEYSINGIDFTHNWTGNLTQNQTETISLPVFSFSQYGEHTIQIKATLSGNPVEYDNYNNNLYFKINRNAAYSIPFKETFENGITDKFNIENIDNELTWKLDTVTGTPGFHSIYMDLYNYDPRTNQKDGLISAELDLTAVSNAYLAYDFAYQKYHTSPVFQDTFKVFISSDCGENYTQLKMTYANEMATVDGNNSDAFEPTSLDQWIRDTIDISSYAGQKVLVKFETTNRKGNNLYLDNICVYETDDLLSAPAYQLAEFNLYPNPAKNEVQLIGIGAQDIIMIFDITGREVFRGQGNSTIDTRALNNGQYIVYIEGYEKKKLTVVK